VFGRKNTTVGNAMKISLKSFPHTLTHDLTSWSSLS